ncbi:MAG: iron complex outermembrane receptor protein [Oceanospirillaceae bacterium]|jgi:iron complex outermembrane receptor protein
MAYINTIALKASYSKSSRTTSPAELGCANEDDPCKLPNSFVSDPPLEQVIVTTAAAGGIYHQPNQQYLFTLDFSISDKGLNFHPCFV